MEFLVRSERLRVLLNMKTAPFLLIALISAWTPAYAVDSVAAVSISAPELQEQIAQGRSQVPEFEFIRSEAQRLGVRVWLFGGTAAGYAHYVKWNLLRQKG